MPNDPYYDKFKVFSGEYWDVYVSDRGGNNLGRMYLWLHRDYLDNGGPIRPHDLTRAEKEERDRLLGVMWVIVRDEFGATHYNWSYLANEKAHGCHCHYHFEPRYEEDKEFMGHIFHDPAPTKRAESKRLDDAVALQLVEHFKQFSFK